MLLGVVIESLLAGLPLRLVEPEQLTRLRCAILRQSMGMTNAVSKATELSHTKLCFNNDQTKEYKHE